MPVTRETTAGFASIDEQAAALGATVEVVPVPWDCRDGFFSAFWRRPEAYLDPNVREGISVFHRSDPDGVAEASSACARTSTAARGGGATPTSSSATSWTSGYRLLVTIN